MPAILLARKLARGDLPNAERRPASI